MSQRWRLVTRKPRLVAALGAVACTTSAAPSTMDVASQPGVHAPVTAIAVDSALAAVAARPLWPGFAPLSTPLAIFDGTRTWLFRHPAPPAGYAMAGSRRDTWVRDGRDSAVTANSSAMIGGTPTATIFLRADTPSARAMAALAVHELFHVFQRARHRGWQANEADLFTYPVENEVALALRREETSALVKARSASSTDSARCWTLAFDEARRHRFDAVGVSAAAYERGTELNEGLARYVELRASDMPVVLSADDYPAEEVRQRAYEIGAGVGQLLDRVKPDWRDVLEAAPATAGLTLDGLLATAVERDGPAARCEVPGRSATAARAASDVRALGERRTRARADFLAQPGWRLVLEPGNEPLFPQGFDPLNVRRLTATEVLHGRYLKLGNGAGAIELFSPSLTEGRAGAHPVFAGVVRLTVTGLAVAPAVRDSSGVLTIDARGIHGRWRGARADTSGQSILVRMH